MVLRSANWRRPARASARVWSRGFLFLLVALALLCSSLSAASASGQSRGGEPRVHPRLEADIAANPGGTFRVIIQSADKSGGVESIVRAQGGRKLDDLAIGGFVAELPAQSIRLLANSPGVQSVVPDAELVSTGWGASRVAVRKVFTSTAPTALDPSGHGTLVAGIAAGNSWSHSNLTLRGKYMGIAPDAKLIDLVVSDADGMAYTSAVVNAIDWAIANRVAYNIRVMNLSLISGTAESYKTSILAAAVERAWFNGILVVAAAGNAGPNTALYPPANDPFVVTVGANDAKGNWWAGDDTTAPWSSYGTTQDGYKKPNVVAPGRYAPGPVASNSAKLWTQFPSRGMGGTNSAYMWMSGTSMAAPMVAGAAAVIFEKHPEWTNDQVKMALALTAVGYGSTAAEIESRGAGVIDLDGALWYPEYYGVAPGFANQGLKMSSMLTLNGTSPTYSSASWSTASWSTASWSTASWSTASWSTASWSTVNGAAMTQLQASDADVGDAPSFDSVPPKQVTRTTDWRHVWLGFVAGP
jgi:serine protease AprX